MTNIYFSPTYTGHVFLQSEKDSVMMDTQVVSLAGLVALLELRLGIHHDDASPQQRIICYHDCMKQYLAQKKGCLFAKSFEISPLSTAKAVLAWRDELRWTGWSSALTGTGASERLQDLAGIEKLFEKKPDAYDMVNHLDNLECMLNKQSFKIFGDLTILLPYDKSLLRPKVIELLNKLEKYGASIKQTPTATGGNNNLSTVRRLLCASTAEDDATLEKVTLADKKADDSLLIWRFPDERAAAEYLAYKELADIDVWINADNKQMDNWLARMRRPLTGSVAKQCTPQLTQLFVIGLGLFRKTLNINTLMGWLTMPLHPLESYFRAQLTAAIAREGGYRNEACRDIIRKYIAGDYVYLTEEKRALPEDEQQKIRQKEMKQRVQKVLTYLPPTEKPTVATASPSTYTIATPRLLDFARGMEGWARQQAFLTADDEQLRREQLLTVADLFQSLTTLLTNHGQATVDDHTLATWVSTLYAPADYTNAVAEQGCRIVIDSPAKIVLPAERTAWLGVEGDEARPLECAFLSPAERDWLADQAFVALWPEEKERASRERDVLNAFLRTRRQLILVVCDHRDGEQTSDHSLLIRLKEQVADIEAITAHPNLDAEKTVQRAPRGQKHYDPELTIQHPELFAWPDHLSPTTLDKLVENPLDFVLQYLLHIEAAEELQAPDIRRTRGNVAHAVIEQLFAPRKEDGSRALPEDHCVTTPEEAAARLSEFDVAYAEQLEAKGGQLQLEENLLEEATYKSRLRECVGHLVDIMKANQLSVTACELQVEGRLPDVRLPRNEEKGDRNLTGFIDMTLIDEEGRTVVFDFKWTKGNYYKDKLDKNRSVQLELYRYMLNHSGRPVSRVAYFLMPRGILYSRDAFQPVHFEPATPTNDAQNAYGVNIVEQIRRSIIYRKEQIDRGKIETEGILKDKQYNKDTQARGLFPLENEMTYIGNKKEPTENKMPNGFSDYPLLNGKEQ